MILSIALATLVAAAPAPDAATVEARAAEQVSQAFAAAKLAAPQRDAALSLAARDLAGQILAGRLSSGGLADAVPAAISRAGGWDPAPRTLLLSGTSADALVAYVRNQPSLTEERSDVVGIGVAQGGAKYVLLLITGQRLAELKPFPRALPVGGEAKLEAAVRAPLASPQLVVTGPDGRAGTSSEVDVRGSRLSAPLRFPKAGRYTIEVVGRGPEGPRVAAIFAVLVGSPAPVVAVDEDGPEPADPIAKIDAVLARINRVRAKAHLKPLIHDKQLDVFALEHAEDMAKNHFFAHVSPTRGDLKARLAGKYTYVRAGENLGEAGGALTAERAIEGSPAHLENTLDPSFTHIGLALYPNRHPGGEITLLLAEIFAAKPPPLADPVDAILRTLNHERQARSLAPLARDPILERVAAAHLKEMISDGMPGGERDAQDAALEAESQLESVAVDLFIGTQPDDALRSRNALAKSYNRMGVAAQVVSNRRYGPDRLWICVLYGQVLADR